MLIKGGWSQGEVGFELNFSAKSASKNSEIRQYNRVFILSFNEKILFQNCRKHFKECILRFITSNKIADYPDGYQNFL